MIHLLCSVHRLGLALIRVHVMKTKYSCLVLLFKMVRVHEEPGKKTKSRKSHILWKVLSSETENRMFGLP